MNALVFATHDGQQLDPATACVVTAARQLVAGNQGLVHVLILGHQVADVAAQAAAIEGVDLVKLVDQASMLALSAETLARQLKEVGPYDWVLGCHNLVARAAFPRAAALAGAAFLSDVVRTAPDTVERPAYAGAVLTRVRSTATCTFITVRPSAYVPATSAPASTPARIEAIAPVAVDARTRLLTSASGAGSRPDLGRARIVVAGGRGVGSAQNMRKLEQLADHLGAAVGASRAAVDAGFASNAVQIGQTGKTIAPDVYLAMGISGAIQHLAGIKDAKCIVAVNKDPDAPIFQIADFGVEADLFDALPLMMSALPPAAIP